MTPTDWLNFTFWAIGIWLALTVWSALGILTGLL